MFSKVCGRHRRVYYSLLPNFVEWFLANIFVTRCRSHMGVSALDSEWKLWRFNFLHLMTFLVTLTFHFDLPLEMLGCLDHLAHISVTIEIKTCNPSIFQAWIFYIRFNGHVPDEYFPDVIKKNWLHLNHTISILWWYAKLHYCLLTSFRVICKKPFHKIRQRTVVFCVCIISPLSLKKKYVLVHFIETCILQTNKNYPSQHPNRKYPSQHSTWIISEIDEMDEELPPVMAAESPDIGQNTPTNSPFTKASIKAKFKAIRWSTLRKSKRKRPAVLQEVSAGFYCVLSRVFLFRRAK